jgi:hypothetical protein
MILVLNPQRCKAIHKSVLSVQSMILIYQCQRVIIVQLLNLLILHLPCEKYLVQYISALRYRPYQVTEENQLCGMSIMRSRTSSLWPDQQAINVFMRGNYW